MNACGARANALRWHARANVRERSTNDRRNRTNADNAEFDHDHCSLQSSERTSQREFPTRRRLMASIRRPAKQLH